MAYTDDHIALAAEYALGTLDADERVQVETMMAVDREFVAVVQAWEYRLGVLNQMVGSVEPRPIVWENILAAIGPIVAAPEIPLAQEAPLPPLPEPPSLDVQPAEPPPSEPAQPEPSPSEPPHVAPGIVPPITPEFMPRVHAPG